MLYINIIIIFFIIFKIWHINFFKKIYIIKFIILIWHFDPCKIISTYQFVSFFFGINLTNENSSATFLCLHKVRYQNSKLHCFGNFWPLKMVRYRNSTLYNYSKNRLVKRDVKCHKSYECIFLITNWFWGKIT